MCIVSYPFVYLMAKSCDFVEIYYMSIVAQNLGHKLVSNFIKCSPVQIKVSDCKSCPNFRLSD